MGPKKGQHGQTPAKRAATQKKYNAKPEQVKRRGERNAAREKMIKLGRVKRGDGMDVAHDDNNTANNSNLNLLVQTKKQNRSFKRGSKGQNKG